EKVDDFIKSHLSYRRERGVCPEILCEAMSYSLTAGGKRLRPILSIAAYEAIGGEDEELIIPIASSIEFIHTYSLIHDDLPAMDDDDLRRGRPTNHKVFGEATAILAGDALLTEAFSIISNLDAPPMMLLSVIKELSAAAGPEGMVGGQMVDILSEGKRIDKETLCFIHQHKTGDMITSSVRIGAIVAQSSEEDLQAMTLYGGCIGMAFQIVDDILDVTGTTEELGKTAGADAARGKNTYPAIFGLEKSEKEARRLIREAIKAVAEFGERAEPLRDIARYILERRN
ncbi:MAG: polyprenyl synthetase family protein, partial [Nitrospirae bacterium]